MEESPNPRAAGNDRSTPSQGDDYEYDEAHDALAGPADQNPKPRPASPPPSVEVGEGGDYGYDEARDFGRR